MFNVANKSLLAAFAAVLAAAAAVSSCGDSGKRQRMAEAGAMVDDVRVALESGRYADAIEVLDSLQARYPDVIDAQRQSMALRPKAIEGLTVEEIERTDSLRAFAQWRVDSLAPMFRTEDNPKLVEPYSEAKTAPADLYAGGNTVVARLTASGEFYMVSSLAGTSVNHTSISLSSGDGEVVSGAVPFVADKAMTREIVHFNAAKSDSLGAFAAAHDNHALTLKFIGKRTIASTLAPSEVHAIADTWRMAHARADVDSLTRRGRELEARLQVARDQQARTSADGAAD